MDEINYSDLITENELAEIILNSDPWKTLGQKKEHVPNLTKLANEGNNITLRREGKLLGFLIHQPNFLFGEYLKVIGIHPEFRSQGLGKTLLDAFEKKSREKYKNSYLCVSSFNDGAQKFYKKHGYQIVGTLDGLIQPEYDEILMRKKLN